MTAIEPVSLAKIRFCNSGDEGRRGWAQIGNAAHGACLRCNRSMRAVRATHSHNVLRHRPCLAPSPICLSPGGDACVLGVVERAGNALYGTRVYVEVGRRLAQLMPPARAALIRSASLSAIGG